jgi:hypothetical protein
MMEEAGLILQLEEILSGGDRRSKGQSEAAVALIDGQEAFSALFSMLYHPARLVVMRAADAVEKVTITHPGYLAPHKDDLLQLLPQAAYIELKWHLAQLAGRIGWSPAELKAAWQTLSAWALDSGESRIVRVFSLQTMFDLAGEAPRLADDLEEIMSVLEREPIPSMAARLRMLRKLQQKRSRTKRS